MVHYPDGHATKSIPDYVKGVKFMWTFAPDNRITEHPVRFGTAMSEEFLFWDNSTLMQQIGVGK